MTTVTRAWEWRKGHPATAWLLKPSAAFHAYDVNDNAACDSSMGLGVSVEKPNEGSELCPACVAFVKANPAGREARHRSEGDST